MPGIRNSQRGPWEQVAVIAESQLGVVTLAQLRLVLADSTVEAAVARGRLHPIFHGVYCVGHPYVTARARLLAATLACGSGTVVSHGTAAWLLGIRDWQPREIDVIAPVEAGRKIAGIKRRFVPVPTGQEVWLRGGVPVTSAARTVVDCAGILDARGVGETIEGAAIRGLLDVAAIDRVLEGARRRGTKRLLVALAPWRRYRPGIKLRSRMEAKLLPLLTEAALPVPETNAKVRVSGRAYEVDFLWRREKLVVETDGGRFHDNPIAGLRDSERNRDLIDAGYEIPRLGWEDLRDRPGPTVGEIARLLRISGPAVARRHLAQPAADAAGADQAEEAEQQK